MARWYYYADEPGGVLEKIRNLIFRKLVPEFPNTVLIETQYGCNAGCVFCQYPQLKSELPRGRMSDETFEKIAKECAGRGVERFILALDNEPLLDRTIARKFEMLRKYCPESKRNLTTNASILTKDRIEELIGSGAVNEVFLSINGYTKETYEELMKLPFERTMKCLDGFCEWLREHPEIRKELDIAVKVVKTRRVASEIEQMRARWEKEEGFRFLILDLDNRGDQLDMSKEATLRPDCEEMEPNSTCRRPFNTMVITLEGEAVICCVDYKREVKLGNINEHSVYDIWNGPRATQLRREYLAKDFTHLVPCKTCKIKS